jgi:O-antigen ligase
MKTLYKFDNFVYPDRPAFWAFLGSGTFIILIYAPLFLRKPLSFPIIVFIYLLPWVLVWGAYSFDVIKDRAYRIEIILMVAIIILGIVNVLLSDDINKSSLAMRSFLLSGIVPLWTSIFLLANRKNMAIFYYFCCLCIAVVGFGEFINFFNKGGGFFFMYHAIPLGTLIILLSMGPLNLLSSDSNKIKMAGVVLLTVGLILIVITRKRGSILAVVIMSIAWIYRRYIKSLSFVVALILTIALLIPIGWTVCYSLNKNIPSHSSILQRLELYPFSIHVYKKHLLFGIGLQSYSYQKYLKDYEQKNQEITDFSYVVKNLQKLENMFLTAFVELGTIMTLVYLGLIIYIILKYCRHALPFSLNHKKEFVLLLPLIGLTVHSLTYDSLLWPQINWLFHVQLGILAGYEKNN